MAIKLRGQIHVTGENDAGKTTFIMECGAQPEKMCFFGDDVKDISLVEDMKEKGRAFGEYHDLVTECSGMKELAFHDYVMKLINAIPSGKYDVIAFDTWSRFETTLQPYVASHLNQFKDSWSAKGDIKGAQIWQESYVYEARIFASLLKKAPLVIYSTHIKDDRLNGIKTGKMIADVKKPMETKSHFRLWLRKNPNSPAPIGLVLKRPSIRLFTDNGIKTINILPYRLDPGTWEKIGWYIDNPIGDRRPEPGETPDEYELSVIKGVLSADQMEVMRAAAATGGRDLNEDTTIDPSVELRERAKSLKSDNKSMPVIATELGITVPEVVKLLSEA